MADNFFNSGEFLTSLGIPVSKTKVDGKSTTIRGASFIQDQLGFGRQTGYMRANRYCLLFQGVPSSIEMKKRDDGILSGVDNKRLSLNCLQASIPESSFSASDMQAVGPKRTIPHNQNFGDNSASFQFNCGTDLYEYTIFRAWQRSIIDPVSRYVAYYDDYAKMCSLTVIPLPNSVYNFAHVLELMGSNRLYGIKLTEVYPKSVSVNQFQNTSTNNVLVCNVNFGYREIVPHYSWDDDLKYAVNSNMVALMDMTTNTVKVSESQLHGIRKGPLTPAEERRLFNGYLAKEPMGAKIAGGNPSFEKYLQKNRHDPSGLPEYAGEPDLFLNNLITSGINTSALFRGI